MALARASTSGGTPLSPALPPTPPVADLPAPPPGAAPAPRPVLPARAITGLARGAAEGAAGTAFGGGARLGAATAVGARVVVHFPAGILCAGRPGGEGRE